MVRNMTSRSTTPPSGAPEPARMDARHDIDARRDDGISFIEIIVGIALMATVVLSVLSALTVTIKASAYERDHAKAQQWLQAAIGVIEAVDFKDCDPAIINGTNVQAFYQEAVDVGRVDTNGDGVIDGDDGARRPWEYAGVLEVKLPKVWDGEKFVDFDTQSVCYDQSRLRQQLVRMEVTHPSGVVESVEMIKVDR